MDKTSSSLRSWAITLLVMGGWALAQNGEKAIVDHIESRAEVYGEVAQQIWEWAELGYLETKSSKYLQAHLADEGFEITEGVAGIPTAFLASYGTGSPVIAILAEFDALPGISQDRSPERNQVAGKNAGHACGHHLFGTGSVAAAAAVRDWLQNSGTGGTIRLYGTPAEEGGAGKVYMVREGLFDDVDIALHWHAGDQNSANPSSTLANKSAKFRFRGISAHAAGAPERGRSALDGVEAMNHMVNMLREHVPQETRIHYVITYGGAAPNVIPDFSEVFYYVRNPEPRLVLSIFERVVNAARGAALGTGTEMDYEVIHGLYNVLPNVTLSEVMHSNLSRVGGVRYNSDESRFAATIAESLGSDKTLESAAQIQPLDRDAAERQGTGGSTDVGDVSWTVPTVGLRTATWVPGTAAHSWQAIAAGGTSIGNKGMMVAAKTLALTAVELFQNPDLIAKAKAEFERRRGENYTYIPLLGDRDPPLDYRKPPGGR